MIGLLFKLGEIKKRPNVYVRWKDVGAPAPRATNLGVCAAIVQSNWGEVGKPFRIERAQMDNLKAVVGSGVAADTLRQAFLGGATYIEVLRVGQGGKKATLTLGNDGDALTFTTLYETDRQLQVITRESLDGNSKDFIILENGRNLESHTITSGINEVDDLKAALANSSYLQFVNGSATTIPVGLTVDATGGTNPNATTEDYVENFETINKKFWDALILDTTDLSIKAAANSFIRRRLEGGGRSFFVTAVTDPTQSIEVSITEAKSYNNFCTVLVGNGARTVETDLTGPLAAARIAGMITSSSYKSGLTRAVIAGATELIGEPTDSEYGDANENGLLTFSYNPDGMVQVERGINTLVSLGPDEDAGWKKIRRVKIRYRLIEEVSYKIDQKLRQDIDNSRDMRAFICQLGDSTILEMVRDGALQSGQMLEDPDRPAQGDSAWFVFQNMVDLDSLEKVYNTMEFQY